MLSILNAGHLPLKFYLKPNLFMILVSLREYLSRLIDHALILTLLLNLTLIYLNVARNSMLLGQVKIYLSWFRPTIFLYSYCVENLRLLTDYFFLTFNVLNWLKFVRFRSNTRASAIDSEIWTLRPLSLATLADRKENDFDLQEEETCFSSGRNDLDLFLLEEEACFSGGANRLVTCGVSLSQFPTPCKD